MNRALFVVAIALQTGCSRHPTPAVFSFEQFDAFQPGYKVELCDSSLCYYAFAPGPKGIQPVRITATAAQWRQFRRRIDAAGVWQWQDRYGAPGFDGWYWDLEI